MTRRREHRRQRSTTARPIRRRTRRHGPGTPSPSSGGLTAHARPFVVGQAFSCASCATGLVITSLSVPPTQSTATGAGEVGQTFTFTATNAAGASIGGSGTGTVTAGCTLGKRRVELHQRRHRAHRQRSDRDRHLRREQPQRQCAELRRAERQVPGQRNRRDRADLPRRHAASDVRECRHTPPTGSVFDDGVDLANRSFQPERGLHLQHRCSEGCPVRQGSGLFERRPDGRRSSGQAARPISRMAT